jgi:copper(I)-binding protein
MLSLAACHSNASEAPVTVEDAVLTLPAVEGRPGAVYFVLRSNGGPARLTGVSSPGIGRVEFHQTVTTAGVSRMRPLREAPFGPGSPLEFKPGARHAMAFRIDPRLRPGQKVALTFAVDPGSPVTVNAEVRAVGDVGHADH